MKPVQSVNTRAGLTAACFAALFWAIGNVMVRKVPLDGLQIAFWRITLSAVAYTLYLYLTGGRLTATDLRKTAPTAVAISLEIAAFFVALNHTTVANTTVISNLVPLILLGVAARRFGEAVTGWLIGASVIAVGGVALVVFGSSGNAAWSPKGDLLAVVAMLLFAVYFALAKSAREHVGALEFQTAIWIIGAGTLAPLAFIDAGGFVVPSLDAWWWLLGLAAVPGTGHLLMNWAHPRVKLSTSSMLTLGIPAVSTAGAALFLNESVAPLQIIGMMIVVVVLVQVVRREAALTAASKNGEALAD